MRCAHNYSRWTRLVGVFCRHFLMHSKAAIARALATAIVAGPLTLEGVVDRSGRLFGKRWRWLRPLASRIVESFGDGPRPRRITVTKFILGDRGFAQAYRKHELKIQNRSAPPRMLPAEGTESWAVPDICTVGELADWLGITIGELEWFADLRSLEYKRNQGGLRHYNYRPLAKRFGRIRLIEAPKTRLKEIQRRLLVGILDQIPAHDAAHGFCRGRSIKTFASKHIGKRVLLRMDLEDFFPSISIARVQALFRTVGYPESVSDRLAALCANSTPSDIWQCDTFSSMAGQIHQARRRYSRAHLPQGAPTSPALANLSAYRLDCRLLGLARWAGASYTRYADDLAFSGDRDFERVVKRFLIHVSATVMEEGFVVHHRKTRIMRQGVRQQLAGIVVNARTNVSRVDYERLKATLVNSIRHGPQSQNRAEHHNFRAHLSGRISFVEMINPARGEKLRQLFVQISEW